MNNIKNMPGFQRMCERAAKAFNTTAAAQGNRALLSIAYNAMHYTPFANKSQIKSRLLSDKLLIKLAMRALQAKKGQAVMSKGKVKKDRRGNVKTYNTTRKQIAEEAKKILKARTSRIKALRAGWIPSVYDLGGTIEGDQKRKASSTADSGGAKKMRPGHLEGAIKNTLVTKAGPDAIKHGIGIIQEAEHGLKLAIANEQAYMTSSAAKSEYTKAMQAAVTK